jgi:hypothetical protein
MKGSRRIRLLCLVLLTVGCSSVSVSTDFDSEIDFTRLSSYNWMPAPEQPSAELQKELSQNTLIEGRVKRAVDAELAAKGIRKATQDPDMLVAFLTGVQDKVDVQNWGYGYGWGRRRGPIGGSDVTAVHYEEGTLILDFVDPKTKKLIWRGVGKGVLPREVSPEKSQENINKAVEKILAKYPPS